MNILPRKAENREEWRKLLQNLKCCPNGQPDCGIDKMRRSYEQQTHFPER